MYLIILVLSLLAIHYICCGPLAKYLSVKFYHDYPGPKIINKTNSNIDWLCIHGASVDARLWNNFITDTESKYKIAAISIGNHEKLPSLASPNASAAVDITDFLKSNHVNRGIIAHSTGALWLASSYNQNPEIWNNKLKILLIAPNFGNNLKPNNSRLKKFLLKALLKWILLLVPDPALAIKSARACSGSTDYAKCIAMYRGGKRLRLYSRGYYQKLLDYMQDAGTSRNLAKFLEVFANQITIVIATNDAIVGPKETLEIANYFNIKVVEIEDSHVGIINQHAVWFK